MKVTRRTFVAGTLGSAALAALPVAGRASSPGLLVADPALLTAAPSAGTLAASGTELLTALLPQVDRWPRIEAVLGHADTEMLAQLVRFQPGLRWSVVRVEAGTSTAAGVVNSAALLAIATK